MASLSPVEPVSSAGTQDVRRRKKPRKQREQTTKQESLGGAIVRSLFGTLAFLFKRPVRLFRPVKLSSWTILEAMAKREGRSGLSIRYLRSLLRRERSSFLPHLLLPPLLFNTAIGFTLFQAYSITESRLLAKSKQHVSTLQEPGSAVQHEWTPLWIVTVSGAVAGAAQCFLSAPLDNVRYIMQQNVHQQGRRRAGSKRISNISWRAIIRAAILPFAPAIARDRLVKAVHNDTIRSSTTPSRLSLLSDKLKAAFSGQTNTSSTVKQQQQQQQGFGMSSEKRLEWEKRLKRWRGGIHGSGLALSLIRDSVGFGSFFCIFEVSRRCAYHASTSVDRISAFFNGRGLGIVLPGSKNTTAGRTSGNDVEVEGVGDWIRQSQDKDADLSYNTSRTVQGRVVAVVILLIGGAVGALSYELVGRPFELMRIVIWQGRKLWEQGKRETDAHSQRHKAGNAGRSRKLTRLTVRPNPTRLQPQAARRANTRQTPKYRILARQRHRVRALKEPSFAALQAKATKITQNHRLRPIHGPTRGRNRVPITAPSGPDSASKLKHAHPSPTLATRPGFLTLLLEHAESSTQLDRKYGAPDTAKMSKPLMLLHTYFIAPFLPEIPRPILDNKTVREAVGVNEKLRPNDAHASKSSVASQKPSVPSFTTVAQKTLHMSLASRRRAVAETPEDKVKRTWVRNNSVNSSLATEKHTTPQSLAGRNSSSVLARLGGQGANDGPTLQRGTRYWASGRVTWALKRLATPYGVAFLVFAWLGGDLN